MTGTVEARGRSVVAVVPARNEGSRVGLTVAALRGIDVVTEVLVVDDGSVDDTAARALGAGATCLSLRAGRGKGGALNAGLEALMGRVADGIVAEPAVLLLADADLEETAGRLEALLDPVLADVADLAVADLPAQPGAGGFGLVMGLAHWGIHRLEGLDLAEPLSGQRAIRWPALRWLLPLAPRFGVEVAMTLDAAAAGLRVLEVPVELRHAATGRDLGGIRHRSRQGAAVVRELIRRGVLRPTRAPSVARPSMRAG